MFPYDQKANTSYFFLIIIIPIIQKLADIFDGATPEKRGIHIKYILCDISMPLYHVECLSARFAPEKPEANVATDISQFLPNGK